MKKACPKCGFEVDVPAERQELCPRCQTPVWGEGFDPQRYYGPKIGGVFDQLREPNHWDYLLGGWLIGLGVLCVLAGLFTIVLLAPGYAMLVGGRRIFRAEADGARLGMAGVALILAPLVGLLIWMGARGDMGNDEFFVLAIVTAFPAATLGILIYYARHPYNRYRSGRIDQKQLERILGEARYNALIHRLNLEAQEPDE